MKAPEAKAAAAEPQPAVAAAPTAAAAPADEPQKAQRVEQHGVGTRGLGKLRVWGCRFEI